MLPQSNETTNSHRDLRMSPNWKILWGVALPHPSPPRGLTAADAAVEQIDFGGNFLKQRIERIVEEFESGDLGVVQIDDDAAAVRLLDPCLAQRIFQTMRRFARLRLIELLALTAPHGRNVPIDRGKARAPWSAWG